MQAEIDKLKGQASNRSDKAKTEMHKKAEALENQGKHWALSSPLSEQSDGSLCL